VKIINKVRYIKGSLSEKFEVTKWDLIRRTMKQSIDQIPTLRLKDLFIENYHSTF
jgi:hypothetical protein